MSLETEIFKGAYELLSPFFSDDVFVYKDSDLDISTSIDTTIVEEVSTGTDPEFGDYIQYRIDGGAEESLETEGINLNERIAILNGYDRTNIIEHTTDADIGDLIKVTNVSDTIKNYDTAKTAEIEIISSAFFDFRHLELPKGYLNGGRLSNNPEGIWIGIFLKTKYDSNKEKISEEYRRFINQFKPLKGNMSFTVDGNKYTLHQVSEISRGAIRKEKGNIQSMEIYLPFSYMVGYK